MFHPYDMSGSTELGSEMASLTRMPLCVINPFPVMRYRLNFVVQQPFSINENPGALVRSVLGMQFRKLSCTTGASECKGCRNINQCAYPRLFENSMPNSYTHRRHAGLPNPYIVEASETMARSYDVGDMLSFSITLIGDSLTQLDLVLLALHKGFSQSIGSRKGKASLHEVYADSEYEPIWHGENPSVSLRSHRQFVRLPEHTTRASVSKNKDRLVLNFLSPLRLVRKGKLISASDLQASDILMSIVRRYASLVEVHLDQSTGFDFKSLAEKSKRCSINQQLEMCSWSRYSSRQCKKLKGDGWQGLVELQGDLSDFLPIVNICEYLHIGKMTTCGNGRYAVG